MPQDCLFGEFAHQNPPDTDSHCGQKQRQIPEEVGDQWTHVAVQAEVVDEVETQSTADVVELVDAEMSKIKTFFLQENEFTYCRVDLVKGSGKMFSEIRNNLLV